jgi:hypothetical protein
MPPQWYKATLRGYGELHDPNRVDPTPHHWMNDADG